MGEVIELNHCENCGRSIGRDYGRKVPTWVHLATGSTYCNSEAPNRQRSVPSRSQGRSEAEPRD